VPTSIKLPLAEVFEEIGMDTCIRLLAEVRNTEALAMRFCDEFPKLRKTRRNPIGAAHLMTDLGLDTHAVRNLLVRLHQRHQRSLAQIKQAINIGALTEVSLAASSKEENFEERKPHLEKAGIIDSPRSGTNIAINSGNQMNNSFGLPSFESQAIDLEERMKALGPAETEWVDAEYSDVREKEHA
jgi:hypothetical protein